MATLAGINDELANMTQLLEDPDLDIEDREAFTAQVEQYIEELKNKSAETVEGYFRLFNFQDGRVERLKDERDRLSARIKSIENTQDFLKGRVLRLMEEHHIPKLEGLTGSFTIHRSAGKVVIDQFVLPMSYQKEVIIHEVDRAAVTEALKAGETISGVTVLAGGTSLRTNRARAKKEKGE
jgi:hypothetical protein